MAKQYDCVMSSSNTKGLRGYSILSVTGRWVFIEYFSLYERINIYLAAKQLRFT